MSRQDLLAENRDRHSIYFWGETRMGLGLTAASFAVPHRRTKSVELPEGCPMSCIQLAPLILAEKHQMKVETGPQVCVNESMLLLA